MVATPVAERPWEPTGPRGEICGTTRGVAPKHVCFIDGKRATSAGPTAGRDLSWSKWRS